MRFAASLGFKPAPTSSAGFVAVAHQYAISSVIGNALEHSDNIVLVLEDQDDVLRIIAANKEAQRATGYPAEQLIGQPFSTLLKDADPAALESVCAAVREGRPQRAELRCVTRMGQPFWFGMHIIPEDKQAAGRFVVLGHDITEKRRIEAQEKAVQSLLAKVFMTVDAAVYITDQQGFVMMTNPALDRLLGVPAGALTGRESVGLFAPACRALLIEAREKQIADSLDYTLDASLLLDGRPAIACRLTVVMVQRADLNRFRIVTVRTNAAAAAPAPAPAQRKVTAAGRIQLIGLDEVRESLGPRWAALRARAMATAESVFRRRLGPNDTFCQTEDDGYVVCFANATEEEAGFRAATIGNEVRQRLIGCGESPEVAHVFATAVAVPAGTEDLPAAKIADIVRRRVSQRLDAIREDARTKLAEALQNAPYQAEPVYSREGAPPAGWRVSFTPAAKRALDVAIGALPPAEMASLDQDVMLLGFAHECIVERALQSPGLLVFATLSSDILLIRKRMEACLEACQAIAENHRKQLVLAVAAPESTASRQINNGLPRLRPYCRFLGIAVDRLDTTDLDVREAGVALMLVAAEALDATATTRKRAASLRAQRCQLMVHGAPSRDMASLLQDGTAYVSVAGEETCQ